ncbi:putative methionine--tRNA ligase [Rosa chinensis]|uniref:Putative methionine--tRNA ligase n=1 Tax=Rosa chinensis TaxID=74649 RepID=A0A2P6R3J3_ROSCH|nr:putative methionine--tRNA ligase [Rosa chinensis]
MPSFSARVLEQLKLYPASLCDVSRAKRPWELVPDGHKIGKPELLFREWKDEEVESLKKKFGGG